MGYFNFNYEIFLRSAKGSYEKIFAVNEPLLLSVYLQEQTSIFTFLMSADIFVIMDLMSEGFWLGIFWKGLRKNSDQNIKQESALTHIHRLSTPPL